MEIVNKNIEDLKVYDNNPRDNDGAVEAVANSIKTFGFKVPIVIDSDNVIICGHTRRRAAKRLGLTEVPCIIADDLNEEQIKAFRLADNKTAELAEWDYAALEQELSELVDMDMTVFGFEDTEFEEVEEDEIEPDVEFTKSLEEKHNYIVLYFDNEIDWLQAESVFDIKRVKEFSTRKDGAMPKTPRYGVGRVLHGGTALARLIGVNTSENQYKLSELQQTES